MPGRAEGVLLNRGIPFEVKIPPASLVNAAELSEAKLDAELEKGYADMKTVSLLFFLLQWKMYQRKQYRLPLS